MSKQIYVWLQGLIGQFIEGAADAFLIVAGGSTAAHIVINNGTPATPMVPLTLRELVVSTVLGGALYAASFLKKSPLPQLNIEPVAVQTTPPTISPPNP